VNSGCTGNASGPENLVAETRVTKGWLQRWRASNRAIEDKLKASEGGLRLRNVRFRSIDNCGDGLRTVVCGQRPHHRAAAFMSVATVGGTEGRGYVGGLGLSGGFVMVASGHRCHRSRRLAHAVIRRHGRLRRRSHRQGGSHRGERAHEQDQQQEFGGPANHGIRILKRGAPLHSAHPHSHHRVRDRNGAAAATSIGQFATPHNPRFE